MATVMAKGLFIAPQIVRRARVPAEEQAQTVAPPPSEDLEDEEAIARRRALLRERLQREDAASTGATAVEGGAALAVPAPETTAALRAPPGGEESSEESSEYETDDEEEEEEGPGALLKPVFVPKTDREVCGCDWVRLVCLCVYCLPALNCTECDWQQIRASSLPPVPCMLNESLHLSLQTPANADDQGARAAGA